MNIIRHTMTLKHGWYNSNLNLWKNSKPKQKNDSHMIIYDQLHLESKCKKRKYKKSNHTSRPYKFWVFLYRTDQLCLLAEERKYLTHQVSHSNISFVVNMFHHKLSLKLWTLFIIYLHLDSHVMISEMHRPSINTREIYQKPETLDLHHLSSYVHSWFIFFFQFSINFYLNIKSEGILIYGSDNWAI